MNDLREILFRLDGCSVTEEKAYFVTEAELKKDGMCTLRVKREEKAVCELSELARKIEGYDRKFELITAVKCADGSWALSLMKVNKEEENEEKDGSEE